MDRIVEISLAKMKGKTVTSRRRDGNSLRRNLLVSHLLNSAALTSNNHPELQYRNHVEIEIDVDIMDQAVARESSSTCSKCGRDGPDVDFVETGSVICELCTENTTKEIPRDEQTIQVSGEVESKPIGKSVDNLSPSSGTSLSKRKCDVEESHANHEVPCKRQRTDLELVKTPRETQETSLSETKDITALVTVFHNGFSGLSTLCENAKTSGYGIFNPVEQCNPYHRTIVAF